MSERRTIAAAFQQSPKVAEFIRSGVPANDRETSTATGVGESTSCGPKEVVSPLPGESAPRRGKAATTHKKPRRPARAAAETEGPPATKPDPIAAHPKARIQKSIRFLPQLIVQLDEHFQNLPPGDELSLQSVMNEALEMWLQANCRH